MNMLDRVAHLGRLGLSKAIAAGHETTARVRHRWVAERQLAHFPEPRKLHLGCGTVHLPGWTNVDAEKLPGVDISWDLRYGIPGQDGSASFIFCEHFLEHLTASQGLQFLSECRRVLRSDGVLRVAMPSLDVLLTKAMTESWKDQDWLRWPNYQGVKTRAEMLNLAFREWGHQWLYDEEELERRLKEAGFSSILFVKPLESQHSDLKGLETRPDSLLVCEATP